MDVFRGNLRSAIKVFPDSHKNNITNNNWKGFSMGGTSGQIIKNKEGLICITIVFYHSKLQLKNM